MANTNKEVFSLKGLQSLQREVGLYQGQIDGLFGKGCVEGMRTLMSAFKPGSVPSLPNPSYNASDVFKYVQSCLSVVGLYNSPLVVDGKWGSGSENAYRSLVDNYRNTKGLPNFGYAWSYHPNLTPENVAKVENWMNKWGKPLYHVSYLFSCFALETGRSFDPGILNPKSKAVGLIQFMPKTTAPDLGTTAEALAKMTVFEQLDYVFKYFEKYGYIKKCNRLEDYYLSIFYPAHVGKDPNTVVAKQGTTLYEQNKGFDADKKGFYTVGDIAYAITTFYWEGMDPKKRITL